MNHHPAARLSAVHSPTVCPFCSCGCGLYLLQAQGRLNGVSPSAHHPLSHGCLCARGWAAHEATLWGNRLTEPMVHRRGALRPATWPEALDEAAARLARLRDAGRAIGVIGSGRATTEDNFMAALLARAALQSPHLGVFPGYWSSELAEAALAASAGLDEAIATADLVLVVEGDLAESHPRIASNVLHAARRGARVATIGLAPSRLTEFATSHLPLRAQDPLYTLDAVLSAFHAEYRDDLTLDVLHVADWLHASARTVMLVGATAPDAALFTLLMRSCQVLAREARALGATVRVMPLPPRANSMGAWWAGVTPDRLPGGTALEDPGGRELMRALCGRPASAVTGMTLSDIIGSAAGMVVLADDVVGHARRVHRAAAALAALDTLVVLDAFHTHASREAHVVLPVAAFGETGGSFFGIQGGSQPTPPCVNPPAGARPAWEVLADLARRLGSAYAPAGVDEVHASIEAFAVRHSALGSRPLAATRRPTAEVRQVSEETREPAVEGFVLTLDGGFDWGADVLISASPTLRREHTSRVKHWPRGAVTMGSDDAAALKLRDHARVRIRSSTGAADTTVSVRPGLERRTLLVPYALRGHFHNVLGDNIAVAVELSIA